MAAIHLTFYLESLAANDIDVEEVDQVQALSECYIYGASTANTRIERIWREIRNKIIGKWLKLFSLISRLDLY